MILVKLPKLPIAKTIIVLLLATFISLSNPKIITAETLGWVKSSGIESYSQEVRIAPSNPSIVYATIRNGGLSGLFKSTSGGLNFSNVFSLASSRDVNSIAISYSNPDKLCIGTYEQGVFCSTNGGSSFSNTGWQNSNIQTVVRFITVDPSNDDIFFAGTGYNNGDGGIYKTTNGGVSWIRVGASTYGGQNTLNIVVDRLDPNRVLAGADSFLYRSYDGGGNWVALPVQNTNSPATVIDSANASFIYTASHPFGIYKSIDNGDTWTPKNTNIEHAFIFRLSQDNNGYLYGSQIGSPGVWRSKDGAETWENVADPAWATASGNTWGLDARNGRILVSVEGLGIYVANADGSPIIPPPPPGPNPVVFIPGLGGSWSYKGLVQDKPTTYSDWELLPILTDDYYQPLLLTLQNSGLVTGQSLFTFAYDYRKSIGDSATSLNQFLDEQVMPKNLGKKVNIAAHSMGGLIARYCYEVTPGCKNKIDKIITGGTPHRGAVGAYDLWEGGKINEKDLMLRTAEWLLLHRWGFPKINTKEIVQEHMPGIRDILPIFNYIVGKPYSLMSLTGQNPVLSGILVMSEGFKNALTAFSGNTINTDSGFDTIKLNPKDFLFSLWVDGKPGAKLKDIGDGTVLKMSSESQGPGNKYYPYEHKDYFRSLGSLSDLLTIFGLPGTPIIPTTLTTNFLTVYASPNITVTLTDSNNLPVGKIYDHGKTVFGRNLKLQNYYLTITGQSDGDFKANVVITNSTSDPIEKIFSGTIKNGGKQTFSFNTGF